MTMLAEHYQTTYDNGDDALRIIDAYRRDVDERFRVEELEVEFPRFAQYLGSHAAFLARAGDNLAGTFKWRGAHNGAMHLQEDGATSLVVPSAGNHARGAILAAKNLDMNIHVVVPETAPPAKKEGLRELWDSPKLSVHTAGKTFDDAKEWALSHPEYGSLLHPYDNQHVAAGQGTIVDDLLRSNNGNDVQHIVLPVGGGGLLAGALQRLDELERTDVTVHAIEAPGSDSLSASLRRGRVASAEMPNQRYGGSAVRQIGGYTLAICRSAPNLRVHDVTDQMVDDLTEDYAQDRYDLWRESTPNYEPTTLVAIAGLAKVVADHPDEKIVAVGTGHNDQLFSTPHRRYLVPV